MTEPRLAHFPQDAQLAEETQLVGDGTEVTTAEAARMLKCSTTHVINLIKRGVLEARTLPGSTHRRIPRTAVEALIGTPQAEESK